MTVIAGLLLLAMFLPSYIRTRSVCLLYTATEFEGQMFALNTSTTRHNRNMPLQREIHSQKAKDNRGYIVKRPLKFLNTG